MTPRQIAQKFQAFSDQRAGFHLDRTRRLDAITADELGAADVVDHGLEFIRLQRGCMIGPFHGAIKGDVLLDQLRTGRNRHWRHQDAGGVIGIANGFAKLPGHRPHCSQIHLFKRRRVGRGAMQHHEVTLVIQPVPDGPDRAHAFSDFLQSGHARRQHDR